MRRVTVHDMDDLALGAAVLGTGGGGDPHIGKLTAAEAMRRHGDVTLIDVGDLADDDLIVPAAMMGAPTVMVEKLPRGDEIVRAVESLQEYLGQPIRAVTPIEAGGLNSTTPFIVASHLGLPLLYAMNGAQARRALVPGTVSLAIRLGGAIRGARARKADPIAAVLDVTGGQRLFKGKIVDVSRRTERGFARGEATIQGLDADDGHALVIQFQNENLIALKDGQVVATVPDLITVLDAETGEPVTTETLRYGFRVVVIGMPCAEAWRGPAALALVGPRVFGYDVDYSPLPTNGRATAE